MPAHTSHAPGIRRRLVAARPGSAAVEPASTVSGASARDRELVAGILTGSRKHFDELYESYFPRVYRFALKRLSDTAEAEDVTQEVFETIFRALPSYRGDSSLLVWIFGITRNKVNRRFRGVRPRLDSIDDRCRHAGRRPGARRPGRRCAPHAGPLRHGDPSSSRRYSGASST